jgi:glycosyltransferase involved in cell wall biosynthesis
MIDALEIRGPFHGPTGYDRHVRGFAKALHEQGVAIQMVDLPEWSRARLSREQRDPWYDTLNRDVRARTVLHCCLPTQVQPERRRSNVNLTMFEATPIPRGWAVASERVERIVVPTASSTQMWQAAGISADRLAIVPLGIDSAAFAALEPGQQPPDLPGGNEIWGRRCRFLNVAEVSGRKNLSGLLRAWQRATTPWDDAVLILKPGFHTAGSRERFATMLADVGLETGVTPAYAAPVHIIDKTFSDAQMPAFFAAATHYVSLSFGEGWDQPMVEAGAAGLRLIAPAHSAYLAYLDATCATLLPSVPVPAAPGAGPELRAIYGRSGMTWWQPDEEAAAAAIRAAIDGDDTGIVPPRERILRELSWDLAAGRLLAVLDEVQRQRSRRRFWPAFHRNRTG